MYRTIKDFYDVNRDEEYFEYKNNTSEYDTKEGYDETYVNNYSSNINDLIGLYNTKPINNCVTLKFNKVVNENMANPKVWGPFFWFSLHNGSFSYPNTPNKIVSERMKGFILGIPYMLPCKACTEHAITFIEYNHDKLDVICSSKNNLFKFFVDFHNYVNKRLGKPEMSLPNALKMYSSCVNVI